MDLGKLERLKQVIRSYGSCIVAYSGGVDSVFLTILNRKPDMEEKKLAVSEINQAGPAGYGNVIWSLLNTREFLFIQ